jgi:hypothetical protein
VVRCLQGEEAFHASPGSRRRQQVIVSRDFARICRARAYLVDREKRLFRIDHFNKIEIRQRVGVLFFIECKACYFYRPILFGQIRTTYTSVE